MSIYNGYNAPNKVIANFTASLFMMAMQNAAAATCFWIQNSFYILDLSLKLKDYVKYPVTIYNSVFQFVFTFIFPVAFIAYYPSMVILRIDNIQLLSYLAPLFGILFFYLSYKLWMLGAKAYDGSGA